MTIRTIGLLATASLAFALGACGNEAKSAAEPSAATTADGGEPAPVALTASGAPKRADGYWTLKNVGSSGTVMGTQHLCIGGGAEEKRTVFDGIAMNVNCSKYDIKRAGAGWNFAFVCGAEPMVSETSGSISGDFTTAYKIAVTAKEGGFSQSRTIEASNAGACPAGVAPGDLNDEQGKKVTNTLN